MGLISDVKCGRCDRRYSGLRARCPYCGARRGKRGKHARDNDNATGRVVIGLILVVVLIVAVIVVIATNMTELQTGTGSENQQTDQGGNIPDSDDTTNIEGAGEGEDDGTEDGSTDIGDITGTDGELDGETGEEGLGVTTIVNTLYITNSWSDDPQEDFTASVGDIIRFGYVCEPVFADAEVLWESSDEDVFVILQSGEFTAVGEGTGTLTLTVNNKSVSLYVVVYD